MFRNIVTELPLLKRLITGSFYSIMNFSKYLRFAVVGACALASCKGGPPTATQPGKYSSTTGLEYNNRGRHEGSRLRRHPRRPRPGVH